MHARHSHLSTFLFFFKVTKATRLMTILPYSFSFEAVKAKLWLLSSDSSLQSNNKEKLLKYPYKSAIFFWMCVHEREGERERETSYKFSWMCVFES